MNSRPHLGGDATFSGTNYQAGVIAAVYAHILAQMRLGWLRDRDDTPVAISGETGGPGDDARIAFGALSPPIELQAKHGLTAGAKLQEAVDRIHASSRPGDVGPIILAVNRGSSRRIHEDLARELEQLRTGRWEQESASGPLRELRGDASVLRRVYPIAIDVDEVYQPEAKVALQLLRSVLEDPDQALSAWALLIVDASQVCANKLRRTRQEIADLLTGAGIKVRPPARDDRWHRQLDFTKQLIERHHPAAALPILASLEKAISGIHVEPNVKYRLAQQRASALLLRDQFEAALVSARMALDLDPKGVLALVVAAKAALLAGDLDAAEAYATRATGANPDEAAAWVAAALVADARGTVLPTPPPNVAASSPYRLVLVHFAMSRAEWDLAIEITGSILSDGVRSPDVLFLRASALANAGPTGNPQQDAERLRDIERLATELVSSVGDDTHPYTAKALVLRSTARRLLGRTDEADQDLRHARDFAANDLDAIRHAAQAQLRAGDPRGAVELLRQPAAESDALLLALRAEGLAAVSDEIAARADIDGALKGAPDAITPDAVRLTAAGAAIDLGDADLAERALDGVSSRASSSAQALLLRGRIAFLRGDTDAGARQFRMAAELHMGRTDVLAELGFQLLKAKRPSDAVSAFDEIGEAVIPDDVQRFFVRALFEAGDLPRAQRVLDRLTEAGPLPNWALGFAADIAVRQEDPEAAVRHLSALVERGTGGNDARRHLAQRLLELGRHVEATPHLDALAAASAGSPAERMATAQLLDAAGRHDEALAIAFRAFRDGHTDPRIHRALVMLALAQGAVPSRDTVGASTHVRLKRSDGVERSVTIYEDGPIDPLRREMSLEDARAAELVGKRVGDQIVYHRDTWQEERWTVEEIKPAIVHVVQDAMMNYEGRFPGEPFFIKAFSIGDTPSVGSFTPMIASLEARKEHVRQVFKLYHESTLPIGFIAKLLGVSIGDVVDYLTADPDAPCPLLTEWSDRDGQNESRAAATESREVVLTMSALETAEALGLLDQLKAAYTLVAPRSLAEELREGIANAEKDRTTGRKTVETDASGLRLREVERDHPLLVGLVEKAQRRLAWLESSARLDLRPLETIRPGDPNEEEGREHIGRSSYDAAMLARHLRTAMYADDLGLRRLVPKGQLGRSFSTVGLLAALADRGLIDAAERDRLLLVLVKKRHAFIPPSRGLLETTLRQSASRGSPELTQAFALLGGPAETPADSARLAMQVAKSHVNSVQAVSLETIVELTLEGMSRAWPKPLCARLVVQAADEEFALLPQHAGTVRRVCIEFLKSSLPDLGAPSQ